MATKTPLRRFWNALDVIPDATTDRRDWRLRLEDDWSVGAAFLKPNGRLARETSCPSPGGDGCPRKVINHGDGRFRAVCGMRPAECDAIDLGRDDLACLALDRAKLTSLSRAIFAADTGSLPIAGRKDATFIGTHYVAAGLGLPVIMLVPGPMSESSRNILAGLSPNNGPTAIVVPTRRSLLSTARTDLELSGNEVFFFEELVTVEAGRPTGTRKPEDLLSRLRGRLQEQQTPATPRRAWSLPPDARWEELVFEFVAPEAINARFRAETRTFDPQVLGMKHKRTGKSTVQWALLQALAEVDGELGWDSPEANTRIKKQKQLLSDQLCNAFGISANPIVWDTRAHAYRTRFKISGEPLGYRHAQRRRR